MTKQDLVIYLGLAEICAQKGLVALEAFQQVGHSVSKLRAAVESMSDLDLMVIQKGKPQPTDSVPAPSAEPPAVEILNEEK